MLTGVLRSSRAHTFSSAVGLSLDAGVVPLYSRAAAVPAAHSKYRSLWLPGFHPRVVWGHQSVVRVIASGPHVLWYSAGTYSTSEMTAGSSRHDRGDGGGGLGGGHGGEGRDGVGGDGGGGDGGDGSPRHN